MLAGNSDAGDPTSDDPVERVSSRPSFMTVMCPWADGESASPFSFTPEAPPIYICHAEEQQLRALGTIERLDVYTTGGHGAFDVGVPTAAGKDWPDSYLAWLRSNQLVP